MALLIRRMVMFGYLHLLQLLDIFGMQLHNGNGTFVSVGEGGSAMLSTDG